MNAPLLLRDASVQEIQMELIRRTQFNAMDGGKVAASLERHRHLWLAALLDRPGVGGLPGLIKLRDLPGNHWNADTLYVLTRTPAQAQALARIIEDEGWGEEIFVYSNQDEIGRALGTGGQEWGLLSVWWD
jgi:hypothetical protein